MLKTLSVNLENALRELRTAEKKKFTQAVELIINLRGIDLEKSENRFSEVLELPNGAGSRKRKICVIGGSDVAFKAGRIEGVEKVLGREEVELLAGNKKQAKKLAGEYEFILVEPALMGAAAKALGAALGSRGKTPVPITPGQELDKLVQKHLRSVVLKLRKSPQTSCLVGTEDMDDKSIVENCEVAISVIAEKLEKRFRNIRSIYLKTTMGKPIRVKLEQ